MWWHWAVLALLVYAVYYLEKIRDLLGWIMLDLAHRDPQTQVGRNFMEDRREKRRLQAEHPFTWWWRQ